MLECEPEEHVHDHLCRQPGVRYAEEDDLLPNENQTLTYRIKMKPGFIGSGETKEMDNTATVYMDDVEKNHDTASYLSSDTATVTKNYTGSYYMPNSSNDDSTGYIFRTKVTADARNENDLTNVLIMDSLEDAFGVTGNPDFPKSHCRFAPFAI